MNLTEFLFNPFEKIAGSKALIIGVMAILLSGLLGWFANVHYDGVLDVHLGQMQLPLWIHLTEVFLNWVGISLVLLLLGIFSTQSHFRVIDIFGTLAFARWPYLLISIFALVIPHEKVSNYFAWKFLQKGEEVNPTTLDFILFYFLLLIIIAVTIWVVALMYKAYKISFNLKGKKLVITFIIGVIAAEILVKVLLDWIYTGIV